MRSLNSLHEVTGSNIIASNVQKKKTKIAHYQQRLGLA